MKKILIFITLFGLLLANAQMVSARTWSESDTAEGKVFIEIGANEATVTFEELGFRETNLVSPFDATRVLFSVPPNWQLTGGTLRLDYEVTLTGADVGLIGTTQNPYGGALTIMFNDQLVGTIELRDLGAQSAEFQLPPTGMESVRQDGRHELVITLGAQFSCIYDIRALVTINPSSTFNLTFEVSSPSLDLSRLPGPFYLRNALVPDSTLVILPDEPDPQELKAGLNVMAGFGSIAGSDMLLDMVTVGELTDETLANNNLIFVGRPEQFDLLSGITFPVTVDNGQFMNLPPESETDGVIEMALSPWNESRVAMLVGGTNSDAVLKAAQAVTSGRILVYENPALSYVSNVQLLADAIPVVEDFTLQNLGYETETLSGIGLDSIQYSFNVSKEQVRTSDGSINLMYYHSGLLDYNNSSFSIELNNQLISSVAFAKESEQLTSLEVKIPAGVLRFGENRLTISARLFATMSCDSTGFSDPWLTISNLTAFHIPATVGDSGPASLLDLKFYPTIFMGRSDLGDVAFIVPRDNPATWKLAGDMAFSLGTEANPLISNVDAAFADDIPQQILAEKGMVVIGRSSTIPLVSEINEQLPAPFDLATDTASERNMQVVYRVPAGMSVGYLELVSSPYNVEKPILLLAGNTDDGVLLAGNALLQSDLSSQLTGVFAITNGSQVATGSSSSAFSALGTLVPPENAVVTTPVPAVPSSAPSPAAPPSWLVPILIASGVAILLIMILVLITSLARKRAEATAPFNPIRSNGNVSSKPEDED